MNLYYKNNGFPQRFGSIFIGDSARVFGKCRSIFVSHPVTVALQVPKDTFKEKIGGGMFFWGGEVLGEDVEICDFSIEKLGVLQLKVVSKTT